jgi:hypothetical protein
MKDDDNQIYIRINNNFQSSAYRAPIVNLPVRAFVLHLKLLKDSAETWSYKNKKVS